jgi:ElaB/YqjD/DUF883 family membrane-anchored ribosome-binding protein
MDTKVLTCEDILLSAPKPFSTSDRKRIEEAFQFAQKAHEGQLRRSGVPYVTHTIATAKILASIGMDASTIIAGLVHDVPEDTPVPLSDIEEKFGSTVAHIVDGITKLGKIKLRGSKEEYFLENLRKMFLAMAEDIRVVIVKLADRLHNMQTLDALPKEKQLRIAQETMDVYAPIANRLGIGEIKGELEDLAFKYLDPKNHTITKDISDTYIREGQADERFADTVVRWVGSPRGAEDILKEAGIETKMLGTADLTGFFTVGRLSSQVIRVEYRAENESSAGKISHAMREVLNRYAEALNRDAKDPSWFTLESGDPVIRDGRIPLWKAIAVSGVVGLFLGLWFSMFAWYWEKQKEKR